MATYNRNDVDVDGREVAIAYVWENRTRNDYRLTSQPRVIPQFKAGKAPGTIGRNALALELPVAIPPGVSKRVRLRLTVPCPVPPLRGNRSPGQQRECTEEIEAKCQRTIADLEGFAVFDDSHRYEIRLPAGWRR